MTDISAKQTLTGQLQLACGGHCGGRPDRGRRRHHLLGLVPGRQSFSLPVNALYPPLTGLYAGGWMIPAVLGMLIIRKPGAALFCETVAATGELIMGSQYGTTVLISGILQGLGAELIFAALVYKKFNLPVALLAGAGAGLFCGLNDGFLPWGWNIAYAGGDKLAYIIFTAISGAVIAGGLSWLATRGLAKTGVLSSFASRKAATEPVFS